MRITELEEKFSSEETLNEVLEQLKEDFEKADYVAKKMRDNITDNPEEVQLALNELSGTFSNLRTALSIAEAEKKNREVNKYNDLKIEWENNPPQDSKGKSKNFVSASAEKEASQSVAKYRRIRNIIRGYKEAVQTGISVLQSLLKYIVTDKNNPQN